MLLVQRHCQVNTLVINILNIHDSWLREKKSVSEELGK